MNWKHVLGMVAVAAIVVVANEKGYLSAVGGKPKGA